MRKASRLTLHIRHEKSHGNISDHHNYEGQADRDCDVSGKRSPVHWLNPLSIAVAGEFYLAVWKLTPSFDDGHITAGRKLVKNFARLGALARLNGRASVYRLIGTFGVVKHSLARTGTAAAMLRNTKTSWSAEDDRRLREMHAAGRTAISMAAALSRSVKAINSRLGLLRTRQRQDAASERRDEAGFAKSGNEGLQTDAIASLIDTNQFLREKAVSLLLEIEMLRER